MEESRYVEEGMDGWMEGGRARVCVSETILVYIHIYLYICIHIHFMNAAPASRRPPFFL